MNDLAKKLTQIAISYLGPAGERFMERQLTHLPGNVTPETIATKDLPELGKWIRVSAKLLLNDAAKADEFAQKIENAS